MIRRVKLQPLTHNIPFEFSTISSTKEDNLKSQPQLKGKKNIVFHWENNVWNDEVFNNIFKQNKMSLSCIEGIDRKLSKDIPELRKLRKSPPFRVWRDSYPRRTYTIISVPEADVCIKGIAIQITFVKQRK